MYCEDNIKNRKEPKVALVVLNYNGRDFIKGCIDSLLAQDYHNFYIFIIDNCSKDKSVDFIKEQYRCSLYPKIIIIENSKNFGIGKGFNDTIKKLTKEFDYIGLFNSDIRVDKNWIKECVATFDKFNAAQVCASFILDWGGKTVDSAGGTIINFFAGVFGGFLGGIPIEKVPQEYKNQESRVFFGILTAMMVRSSAFEKFGFFDEDYFMYFEDIDFSWRVLIGGGKIYCNPKAIVYHYGHGSKPSKNLSLKLLKQTETNLLATYFKNLSYPSFFLVFIPLVLIRFIFSLFYLPISPKVTLSKISGIYLFFNKLLTGQYKEKRNNVSHIRKLNDWQVLMINPNFLFSFKTLFLSVKPWCKLIFRNINK